MKGKTQNERKDPSSDFDSEHQFWWRSAQSGHFDQIKNNEKTISESLLADHVSKSFHCFRRRLSCVCVE